MITLLLLLAQNVIPGCTCDPAQPDTLKQRSCSLSMEAEKQPLQPEVFFLKDINPRKPNRTLALPRHNGPANYTMDQISHQQRTRLWTEAIQKARELWGDHWAVAYNGDEVRTQCHIHLHIGKLNSGAKISKFTEVSSPSEIPAPRGKGIWIYPAGKKLRVHHGDRITETALVR